MTGFSTTRRGALLGALAVAGSLAAAPALADDFFAGRTIDLIVPAGAGGSYGLYALLVSEHLPRHIPGNPTITPNYMGGAGGMRASNYVGSVAPTDGTALYVMHQNSPTSQLTAPEAANFDAGAFQPIGILSAMNSVMVTRRDSGIDSVEDALEQRIVLGSTGRGSYQFIVPTMINHFLDTQFQVITTYSGTGETFLALERGEIGGLMTSIATVMEGYSEWFEGEGTGQIILQVGMERDGLIPDVPTLIELAEEDEQRAVYEFLSLSNTLARSLVAPAGVPEDRVEVLRTAFQAMIADPAYQEAVADVGLPQATGGHELLGRVITSILNTPAEVIETVETVTTAD